MTAVHTVKTCKAGDGNVYWVESEAERNAFKVVPRDMYSPANIWHKGNYLMQSTKYQVGCTSVQNAMKYLIDIPRQI